MNPFIEHFEFNVDLDGITEEQEQELIEHILEESVYTDLSTFTLANISHAEAMELAQQSDTFWEEAVSYNYIPPSILLDELKHQSPTDLAYTIAYEHTELGTQLLDELLDYRRLGRI